jgi:YVTN family beta-propeller protein
MTSARNCGLALHPGPLPARGERGRGLSLIASFLFAFSSPATAAEAFVTAQSADAVSIVDLAAMKTVATLPIGGKPAGVAVSPDGARVYVSSPDGQFVTVIDAPTRTIIRKIPMKGAPLGLAVSPDGRRVYATLAYDRLLVEIDPQTGPTREVAVGAMVSGVAATPDGKTILVADRDDNAVSLIDAGSFTRIATIPVGKHPFGVTIDSAGGHAYSANVESDDVSVIDIAARKVVGTLKTASRPYTVALAAGRIFVADQHADSVSVFDAASLAPAGEVKVGEYPEGIAASADGTRVYVANWFSNELWAIDAKTLQVTGKAETGDGPRAFGSFVTR